MPELVLAWDLETCPLPDPLRPAAFDRRLALATAEQRRRDPDLSESEAARRAASLHPMLGWICCAAAVRLGADGLPRDPVTFSAATPAEEPALLQTFWEALARLPARVRFVTFNGKRFDCDWLRVRSAAHGLPPARLDILDTYPFAVRPHTDLARAFDCVCSLDDLCTLLGVARAEDAGLSGAGVAQAVAEGRLDDVARYAAADALATLDCDRALAPFRR